MDITNIDDVKRWTQQTKNRTTGLRFHGSVLIFFLIRFYTILLNTVLLPHEIYLIHKLYLDKENYHEAHARLKRDLLRNYDKDLHPWMHKVSDMLFWDAAPL